MPIAWHPKRWWNFCMSEDEKKEIKQIFTNKCFQCTSAVYNMEVSVNFTTENFTQRLDMAQKSLSIFSIFGAKMC